MQICVLPVCDPSGIYEPEHINIQEKVDHIRLWCGMPDDSIQISVAFDQNGEMQFVWRRDDKMDWCQFSCK